MEILPTYVSVYHVLIRPEEGIKSLELDQLAVMSWEANPGPLREQRELLTTEPSGPSEALLLQRLLSGHG